MTLPDSAYFTPERLGDFSLAKYDVLATFSLEQWGRLVNQRLAARDLVDFIEEQRCNPNREADRAYHIAEARKKGMSVEHQFPLLSDEDTEAKFRTALRATADQILTSPLDVCDFFNFLEPVEGRGRATWGIVWLDSAHHHMNVAAFHNDRKWQALHKNPPSRFLATADMAMTTWIARKVVPNFDLQLLARLEQKKLRDEDRKKLLFPEVNEVKWSNIKRRLRTWTNAVFNYTRGATLVGPGAGFSGLFKSQVPKKSA